MEQSSFGRSRQLVQSHQVYLECPNAWGTLFVVPSVLLSCQVEIPTTGLWDLMSANVRVDHSPNLELNATVATADTY